MRTKTANWFLCKVRYYSVADGEKKSVTEQYVVAAVSFTDAEASIMKYMTQYCNGDLIVSEIDRCPFCEVMFSDDINVDGKNSHDDIVMSTGIGLYVSQKLADKWYKAKVHFFLDEAHPKKKTSVNYLVNGTSLESARKNIDEVMGGGTIDYQIASVSETKIIDVFENEIR